MAEGLMVETNWLLDVALQQDDGSTRIWDQAQAGRIDLFVPAFCLAEAVKVFEAWKQRWRSLDQLLREEVVQASRSPLLLASAASLSQACRDLEVIADTAESRLWELLDLVSRRATLLELRGDALTRFRSIRTNLRLSPADALVLASVCIAHEDGTCSRFMSRDQEAFKKKRDVSEFVLSVGVEYFPDPMGFLRRYLPDSLRQ